MIYHQGKPLITTEEVERYADVALERLGLRGKDLGSPARVRGRSAQKPTPLEQSLIVTSFHVLHEAGEFGPDPLPQPFPLDGPQIAKMFLMAKAIGSILGFNYTANRRFGEGKWSVDGPWMQ
jgi:hypothetical protein